MPHSLARILVDGYSMLFSSPALFGGSPPYSYQARDALVRHLTLYSDVTGHRVTVIFDGQSGARQPPQSSGDIEVLFSETGQTADEMIERATHRLLPYGAVWVVTDDHAERDTVLALGGSPMSCGMFLTHMEDAIGNFEREIKSMNTAELRRFKKQRQ